MKSVNLENLEGSVKETRSKRYLKRTKKSVRKELIRTLEVQSNVKFKINLIKKCKVKLIKKYNIEIQILKLTL